MRPWRLHLIASILLGLSTQTGCLVTDCDLRSDTPGCTVIDVTPGWLSRNQPRTLDVRFLDAGSTAALAQGAQPTLLLRRPPSSDGGLAAANDWHISSAQTVKASENTVSWRFSGDLAAALRMYRGPDLELIAQLPNLGESNSFPIKLCSSFALIAPVQSLIVSQYLLNYRIALRPGFESNLTVQLCETTGACKIGLYHFDSKLQALTMQGQFIEHLTTDCAIATFGEDILAICKEDAPSGTEMVKRLYRYRRSITPSPPGPELLPTLFDQDSRLYATARSDLVALISAKSIRIFTGDSLTERSVFFTINSNSPPYYAALADFTNDGHADLLLVPKTGGPMSETPQAVLLVQQDGNIWPDVERSLALREQLRTLDPGRILDLAAADMDGDGQTDLIVFEGPQTPALRILSKSPCASAVPVNLPSSCVWNNTSISIGALDQNQTPDIVLADPDGNQLCILQNSASSPSP